MTASRDPRELGVSSRLVADLVAQWYDHCFREHAKGRLLDLGCGKVPFYLSYKDHVAEVVCADWKNSVHKNKHIDAEVDLTQPLPFADNEFDTLILSDVLEHIPTPEQLWSEMGRILSPGGKLILNVPLMYWIHEQPFDYYRYTEFALRRFVDLAGLRLIHLEPFGGTLEVMADVFAKGAVRLRFIGRPLALISQWIVSTLLKTQIGRSLSNRMTSGVAIGYFLVAQKPN